MPLRDLGPALMPMTSARSPGRALTVTCGHTLDCHSCKLRMSGCPLCSHMFRLVACVFEVVLLGCRCSYGVCPLLPPVCHVCFVLLPSSRYSGVKRGLGHFLCAIGPLRRSPPGLRAGPQPPPRSVVSILARPPTSQVTVPGRSQVSASSGPPCWLCPELTCGPQAAAWPTASRLRPDQEPRKACGRCSSTGLGGPRGAWLQHTRPPGPCPRWFLSSAA